MDWNQRYSSDPSNWLGPPRNLLQDYADILPSGGLGFEVAMGMGNDLPFLLEKKFQVLAVDRSEVAVKYVHRHFPSVWTVLADLSSFRLPDNTFDLISNFYYLERQLCHQYYRSLKPGGILLFETLADEMLRIKPDISPERLLKPGEVLGLFSNFEIISYSEGWVNSGHRGQKAVASLVGRKTSSCNSHLYK
jgi:tellurite methyltransferase